MTGSIDGLWRQLGIAPTSDESAIRRAYAKRLRQVRPDDDPAGFQRLVEARDRALRLAQQGAGGDATRWRLPDDKVVEPSPPPSVGPATPPSPPPVRLAAAPPSPPPVRPAAAPPSPPPVRPAAPSSPPPVRPVAAPPSPPPVRPVAAPPSPPPVRPVAAPPSPPPVRPAAAPPSPPPVRPAAALPSPPPVRPAAAPPSPPPVRPAAPSSPPPLRPAKPPESRRGEEWTAVLDLLDIELRALSDASQAVPEARRARSRDVAAPRKADWRPITDGLARLSIADREAIQPHLIRRLSAYLAGRSALRHRLVQNGRWIERPLPFADWPPPFWPFFALVAQLGAEFGWRAQDRVIHLCLAHGEADHFIALLAWAHTVADAGPGDLSGQAEGGLLRVREIDAHAFYDGGRDHDGLRAYHAMRDNPGLWRASDAATYLFFPIWSLRDGRYLAAVLGLVGWASLIVANASWQSNGFEGTFSRIPAKAVLLDAWCAILAIWILLDTLNWKSKRGATGVLRERLATVFFPLWAFARGLYVRGIIGILAWGAVFASISVGLRLGPVLLVVVLHSTAGRLGQRWVAYKLLRTVDAADRAGLSDVAKRFSYVRRRRTAEPRILRWTGGRFGRWLAIIAALTLIQAAIRFLQLLH